jgi:hypothetical protein
MRCFFAFCGQEDAQANAEGVLTRVLLETLHTISSHTYHDASTGVNGVANKYFIGGARFVAEAGVPLEPPIPGLMTFIRYAFAEPAILLFSNDAGVPLKLQMDCIKTCMYY